MYTAEIVRLMKLLTVDRKAVTAVEYAVIVGILVVVIASAFGVLATKLNTTITSINTGP